MPMGFTGTLLPRAVLLAGLGGAGLGTPIKVTEAVAVAAAVL